MIRRSILIGVAALLPVGAQMAGAAATIYDTSAASITCNTVQGSVAIKPFLTFTPALVPTTFKFKAKLNGCVVTGATPILPAPLQVLSGSVAGVLTTTPGTFCLALAASTPVTGDLIFSWKTAAGQKLDHAITRVTPTNMVGGTAVVGTGSYGNLSADTADGAVLVPNSLTCKTCGAFAGAPTISILSFTGEDTGALTPLCTGLGIKTITLAIGQLTL